MSYQARRGNGVHPRALGRWAHARRAATLIELIIGITLAVAVMVLAVSHVTRHQRAYDDVMTALDLRARLRDGSQIIAADLRASSPIGDTILVALDTAVEFYSSLGASTLCSTAAPNRLILPPDTLPSGRMLSSWLAAPETGDIAVVLADSTATSSRGWQRARLTSVTSVPTSAGCPFSGGLLSATDAATPRRAYDLALSPAVPIAAHRGAPVRVVRRVRYSVYRGSDGKWYLGFRRCTSACGAIQPVSGPYQGSPGVPMSLRYFTRSGARISGHGPTVDIGRVEIVSRAYYSHPVRLPGMHAPLVADSEMVDVTLRNRW